MVFMRSSCYLFAVLHCSAIGQQAGTATVTDSIDLLRQPLFWQDPSGYIPWQEKHRCTDQKQTVGNESVLNAVNQIAQLTELGTKVTVKFLTAK